MIRSINHITFAVKDLEKSFKFYIEVLGLKPVSKWKNGAYLKAGDTWLALNCDEKVTTSVRNDYSHIAFTCLNTEFLELKTKLLNYGITEWSENKSEGESFYFTDPDGHKLEIHVGDLDSRLKDMRDSPWDTFEYYD
ncbi:MAG: glutathione transferase [Candidatus Riflebacteria bacterium HGW-Riflebacteria-1]|jgi:catechol 2,3-dioxygenase-like lactoylglutathione lyase family enzyme|nr:MAG: glutathione transferase [Candidatus Riflebacteria bacterium HGW-Riflebacteria-1]